MKLNKVEVGLGGGSLLQVAERSLTQMMSYIVTTPHGKTIMIDGGFACPEDAQNLRDELISRGGVVDYWFITHAHNDHYGALLQLMRDGSLSGIDIKNMCFNFPTEEWLSGKADGAESLEFLKQVRERKIPVITVKTGDVIECDGICVEIISHPENYADYKNVNSTGIIMKLRFPKRDVLFLGDFDAAAEAEFMSLRDPSALRCDIVQMAHHGQGGVGESFYKLINPKICLYTTPIWLWENNRYRCLDPESRGKGPFTTMQTREWMDKLGVELSCVSAFGDYMLI